MTDFLDAVRIEIGDTAEAPGILPGKRHFKDSEILYAAETEGITDIINTQLRDIGRTSARCLEIASVAWSSQPEEVELGPSVEKGKQYVALGRKATILRAIWGFGNPGDGRVPRTAKAPAYAGVGSYVLPPGVR